MRRARPIWIAGILLATLAIVFAAGSFSLGFWDQDGPGPGLLPLTSAILLLGTLVVVVREHSCEEEQPTSTQSIIGILLLITFAALLPAVGFILSSLVLLTLWMAVLYEKSWAISLFVASVIVAAGLGMFKFLLKIPMQLFPSWI